MISFNNIEYFISIYKKENLCHLSEILLLPTHFISCILRFNDKFKIILLTVNEGIQGMALSNNSQSVSPHYIERRSPVIKEQAVTQSIYGHSKSTNENEPSFDLIKILSALLHRKWTVIFTTVAFSLFALIISFLIKPAFKATTMIEISRNSYKVIEFEKMTSNVEDKEFYNTQYGLLTSPNLASRVIRDLNLNAAQLDFSVPSESENILKQKTIEEVFLSYLTITPVLKSRLVKISYENSDPDLASKVVNSLANNFIQSNMEKKRGTNSYTREYLEGSVKKAKQKLEDSELLLDDYASTNNIIQFDETQTVKLKTLQRLEEMLSVAERDLVDDKNSHQHSLGSTGIENVMNNPTIQSLNQQKSQLFSDYQEMLQTFKPNYPAMRRLQERIKQITQEVSLEKNSTLRNTRALTNNKYEASKEKVNELRRKVIGLRGELMKIQNQTLVYNNLKREASSNKELYSALLKRLNEVTVAENVAVNNISIINKAVPPRKKVRPRRLLNVMAGTFLGLFIGSLLALFRELTHGLIRNEGDLEQVAKLPILGKIPKIKSRPGIDSSLLIHNKAHSLLPEAISSFRTNLAYSKGQQPPRSILFTSATSGEGKTSTAINLACAYILLGKKVLLIDADMRTPSIEKRLLKGRRRKGLSNYLLGKSNLSEVIAISKISKKLIIIPSGSIPKKPVELLASKKMAELIALGQQRFDLVIIDSAPVGQISDSIILSTFVDATIHSVKINKTRIRDLSLALDRLVNTNGNLLGVVATDVKPIQSSHRRPQQFFPVLR